MPIKRPKPLKRRKERDWGGRGFDFSQPPRSLLAETGQPWLPTNNGITSTDKVSTLGAKVEYSHEKMRERKLLEERELRSALPDLAMLKLEEYIVIAGNTPPREMAVTRISPAKTMMDRYSVREYSLPFKQSAVSSWTARMLLDKHIVRQQGGVVGATPTIIGNTSMI